MSRLFRCAALLSATLPGLALAEVKVEHNRFKQQSFISALPDPGSKTEPAVYVRFGFKDDSPKIVASMITFAFSSATWRYLKCHDVTWLLDGKPFPMPRAKHIGSVEGRGVTEFVNIENPTVEQIDGISKAGLAEFQICLDEYVVSDKQKSDLRELLRQVAERSKK